MLRVESFDHLVDGEWGDVFDRSVVEIVDYWAKISAFASILEVTLGRLSEGAAIA